MLNLYGGQEASAERKYKNCLKDYFEYLGCFIVIAFHVDPGPFEIGVNAWEK